MSDQDKELSGRIDIPLKKKYINKGTRKILKTMMVNALHKKDLSCSKCGRYCQSDNKKKLHERVCKK